MIKAIWQYVCDEATPRAWSILWGAELWIAAFIGAACGIWGFQIVPKGVKVADLVSGLLTYASIAFGFCLAGLTLALTLPDREFAKKLAASRPGNKKLDAYSDLLFVFSWTAIWHWIAIVGLVGALILVEPHQELLPTYSGNLRRVAFGVAVFVIVYGLSQFLVTLITLSQVGRLYILSLHEKPRP